jgi:hypothetical protein
MTSLPRLRVAGCRRKPQIPPLRSPGSPVELVGSASFMRLSLRKAAHAALSTAAQQEIRGSAVEGPAVCLPGYWTTVHQATGRRLSDSPVMNPRLLRVSAPDPDVSPNPVPTPVPIPNRRPCPFHRPIPTLGLPKDPVLVLAGLLRQGNAFSCAGRIVTIV